MVDQGATGENSIISDIYSLSDQALSDHLEFVQEIGYGNWGSVWSCRARVGTPQETRRRLAVKLVHRTAAKTTPARVRSLWNEMKVIRTLKDDSHPALIKFHSFIITPSYALITMDYLPRLVPVEVRESKAKFWFQSLLSGVTHLHARGIVHNDIKPANILLSRSEQPVLVDFGFAEKYDLPTASPSSPSSTHSSSSSHFSDLAPVPFESNLAYGTPEYLSPERARGTPHDTRKSDVWSLGITFFEIIVGRTPFEVDETEEFSSKEDLERYWARTARGVWIGEWKMSPGLEKVLRKMINPKPELRISAARALDDAYFTSSSPDSSTVIMSAVRVDVKDGSKRVPVDRPASRCSPLAPASQTPTFGSARSKLTALQNIISRPALTHSASGPITKLRPISYTKFKSRSYSKGVGVTDKENTTSATTTGTHSRTALSLSRSFFSSPLRSKPQSHAQPTRTEEIPPVPIIPIVSLATPTSPPVATQDVVQPTVLFASQPILDPAAQGAYLASSSSSFAQHWLASSSSSKPNPTLTNASTRLTLPNSKNSQPRMPLQDAHVVSTKNSMNLKMRRRKAQVIFDSTDNKSTLNKNENARVLKPKVVFETATPDTAPVKAGATVGSVLTPRRDGPVKKILVKKDRQVPADSQKAPLGTRNVNITPNVDPLPTPQSTVDGYTPSEPVSSPLPGPLSALGQSLRHSIDRTAERISKMSSGIAARRHPRSRKSTTELRESWAEMNKQVPSDDLSLIMDEHSYTKEQNSPDENQDEGLAKEGQIDRMTVWIRNVERVVEDTRQGFRREASETALATRASSRTGRRTPSIMGDRKASTASDAMLALPSLLPPRRRATLSSAPSNRPSLSTTEYIRSQSALDFNRMLSPSPGPGLFAPQSPRLSAVIDLEDGSLFPARRTHMSTSSRTSSDQPAQRVKIETVASHQEDDSAQVASSSSNALNKFNSYPERRSISFDRRISGESGYFGGAKEPRSATSSVFLASSMSHSRTLIASPTPFSEPLSPTFSALSPTITPSEYFASPDSSSASPTELAGVYDRFLLSTSSVVRLGRGYQSEAALRNSGKYKIKGTEFVMERPPPAHSQSMRVTQQHRSSIFSTLRGWETTAGDGGVDNNGNACASKDCYKAGAATTPQNITLTRRMKRAFMRVVSSPSTNGARVPVFA